jgi:hypothetical protein
MTGVLRGALVMKEVKNLSRDDGRGWLLREMDDLMQPFGPYAHRAWRRSSVETRAMALLAHEDVETQGHTHEEAVEMSPDTALPVTNAARELLRIIREEQ